MHSIVSTVDTPTIPDNCFKCKYIDVRDVTDEWLKRVAGVYQVRSSQHATAGRSRGLQRSPETPQYHRRLPQGPRHLHQTVCHLCLEYWRQYVMMKWCGIIFATSKSFFHANISVNAVYCRAVLYRIYYFPIWPEPDFGMTNPARAGSGFSNRL